MQKIENIYLERKEDGFNVVILYNGAQVVIASYTRKEKALYPEPAVQEGSVVIALKWARENGLPCPEGLPSVNAGLCPGCGEDYFVNEGILVDGELGCKKCADG